MLVLKPWQGGDTYDTGVGEQRVVMLQDGTRMSLNTSTRVRAVLGVSLRTVEVEVGEALFEVAKDAGRPFVVRAAGSEVTATGTAFVVRYTPAFAGSRNAVDVTLVEGRVLVRGAADGIPPPDLVPTMEMLPGQRVRIAGRPRAQAGTVLKPQVDRPRVDQVLAWKRGEAIFDDASLAEAVGEMNRYSTTPIRLADAAVLGGLRISGVFKTGDNASFARAVATLHGLTVRERSDRLELAPR
ncbi:FecR family protein [Paucibacter sp. JuS9]|uniref:FecR family protein n=1 Tax=Paucibacter sp. JuS9 TaxID=3228748 RepID=UPI0037584622